MIYTYFLYLIFIFVSAIIDAEHIENKQYFSNHLSRFILRLIVAQMVASSIWDFLMLGCLFYLLFDYMLNLLVGNKWNYIGGTSKIDLFWRKYGIWQLPFKVVLFAGALTLRILFA